MYSINVMDEKTNLRYKLTAWLLVLCLVVTLIPDIGFAAGAEEKNNTEEKTVQQPSEGNVEKKTADTTTYDLGCGKHMTVFHGGQVRYKTENGKLQDYDPSLVRIKKGSKTENNVSLENYVYENKQGDKKHYLPEVLSEETPIIMEKGDCSVRFTPSNETLESLKAEDASPHIKKEKTETLYESEKTVPISAVYKSEDKNAEINYTSGDSGIKETITLNEKPESNVFTYIFELENMTARKNPTNEGITFYDLSGEDIKGAVEAPWMNDASGKAYSEDITYDIEKIEGKTSRYLLTMTVDKDYLESEDRQYPVTIDPTTTWKGNDKLRDVYVISGSKYGDENFYAEGTNVMPAGKNSTGVHRTYIKFIDLRAAVLGKNVTSAKLTVYEKGDGNTGQKVSAYKVKKSWGQSTLTWNNKPANETTALATVSASGTAKQERTFTLTNFVKSLAGGSVSNYGIVLKNTTDSPGYASFYGSRNTSTSYRPKLAVTYTDTPATAESASVSPRYVKNSTNATLTYTGLPASALARVEYKIIEYDEAASTAGDTVVDFSENTAISSGDKLPYLEEGCYRVYVRGVNSAGTAGNAKSAGLVRVDRTKPEVGSVTFEDSSGNAITDEFTEESDPVINFSGADDTYLETSGIKYALVPKGTTAAGTDFKAAA